MPYLFIWFNLDLKKVKEYAVEILKLRNVCDHAMFSKRKSELGFKLVTQTHVLFLAAHYT